MGWVESTSKWGSVRDPDDVHTVNICTSGHVRTDIAMEALAVEKQVLLKNSLTTNPDDVDSMGRAIDVASERGWRLCTVLYLSALTRAIKTDPDESGPQKESCGDRRARRLQLLAYRSGPVLIWPVDF